MFGPLGFNGVGLGLGLEFVLVIQANGTLARRHPRHACQPREEFRVTNGGLPGFGRGSSPPEICQKTCNASGAI